LDLLAGTLHWFSRPLDMADAFICLFAVGFVLATIRARTGNIAGRRRPARRLGLGHASSLTSSPNPSATSR